MHPQRQADVLACGPQSTFLETLEVSPSPSGTSMVTPSWPPAPPGQGCGAGESDSTLQQCFVGRIRQGCPQGAVTQWGLAGAGVLGNNPGTMGLELGKEGSPRGVKRVSGDGEPSRAAGVGMGQSAQLAGGIAQQKRRCLGMRPT